MTISFPFIKLKTELNITKHMRHSPPSVIHRHSPSFMKHCLKKILRRQFFSSILKKLFFLTLPSGTSLQWGSPLSPSPPLLPWASLVDHEHVRFRSFSLVERPRTLFLFVLFRLSSANVHARLRSFSLIFSCSDPFFPLRADPGFSGRQQLGGGGKKIRKEMTHFFP